METHVSSTTADVPEAQEVVGTHGNVELVIVVEKLDDEQAEKTESNSQPVAQDDKALTTQPITNDGLPQTSPSKQHVTVGKQTDLIKTVQPSIKINTNKQPTMNSPSKAEIPQTKSPDNDNVSKHKSPAKQLTSQFGVDSTSVKDNSITEQIVEHIKESDPIVTIERESSNDSQTDMNCDGSEKEHNKSISRELKSLINSAKESKIISECTKLTSKTRKSRTALDTSNTNLNVSVEADSIQGNRRNSTNSQKSNSSEKSDKIGKRSMRSQNPEFVNKVKQFLNSVTGKFQKGGDSDSSSASDEEIVDKSKDSHTDIVPQTQKNRSLNLEASSTKSDEKSNKLRSDPYCWRCHWSIDITDEEKAPQPPLKCTVCPRSFHFRCLTGIERTKIPIDKNWVCPGCMTVLHAESSETRSKAMKKISLGMLCELLKFALQRMMEVNGVEPFMQPVDRSVFPDYDKYVVHPMDLSLMRANIAEGLYGSTEAFLGDAHWILHNSIIFNTLQSKLTAAARALVRSCRAEMCEVEACPECYAAAHTRRPTWFTDVCSTPHVLLWAKLKGFPYWPAKAMSVSHAGLADVRFFGAHDRAWVPARDCFLYSEKDPNNFRTKRQDIIDSMQEAEQHIRNISRKYGKFVYAPFRMQFEPFRLQEQLKLMIPSFEGTVKSPVRDKRPKTPVLMKKSRSSSKGSKDGLNVGDEGSDREVSPMDASKMSDEVEKMDEDSPTKKLSQKTQFVNSRKRRRSEPKEAGASTPDTCSKEKIKRVESDTKEIKVKKNESQVVSSSKEIVGPAKAADEGGPVETDAAAPALTAKLDTETLKITPEKKKLDASPQPIKLTDKAKNNDKEKKAPQDAKVGLQNVRSSRSNKSLNNSDAMEVDKNGIDNPSSNKIHETTENNSNVKTNTNKNKSEQPLVKTVEKDKAADSTALDNGKATEQSTGITVNSKEQKNESSTPNKTTDGEKVTPIKNNGKDKMQPEAVVPNVKNDKEKPAETDTPNKDGGKGKNTNNATPSNINSANEKSVETPSPSNKMNDSKEKSADSAGPSNSVDAEKTKASDKVIIGKVVENNSTIVTKRFSIGKDKIIAGKITVTPKASTSKVIKATKERGASDNDSVSPVTTRKAGKGAGAGAASAPAAVAAAAAPAAAAAAAPAVATAAPAAAAPRATTKTTQITVEVSPDSGIFTPTSTDRVRNMKEALSKLQKLKTGMDSPPVGRVGVRSFARIASPPEKRAKPSDVLVEIKAEPMDYEETETPSTSATLETLRPRPAAAQREVRVNRVAAGPAPARKGAKAADVRPRAKKTFPQPKKADDGRAELTNKNSMVYIPIQPPAAQAPSRAAPRLPPPPAPLAPVTTATVTAPVPAPVSASAPSPAPRTVSLSAPTVSVSSITAIAPMGPPPAFAAVPTTVHTVPLITSVNGQWTFSLQPVMSVGGVDSITSPMVNGVLERATPAPAVASTSSAVLAPLASLAPIAPAPIAPAPLAPAPLAPASPAPSDAASRLADAVLGELPRLQQRPTLQSPLAAGTPVGEVPTPSAAGPLTAKLNQNSVKLADFFRTLLEDSLEQLEEPEAQLTSLRLQLEQTRWKYQHEVAELRHTQELLLVELRAAMDKEKARAVAEARRLAHQELETAVKDAKSKQWCANCWQEAQFYCCWNTAYCDYPCQRAHWAKHFGSCTQQRAPGGASDARSAPADPAQPPPADDIPKPAALAAGGARAPELPQAAPILISSDCGGKRVVSSGGYLIVGGVAARPAAHDTG